LVSFEFFGLFEQKKGQKTLEDGGDDGTVLSPLVLIFLWRILTKSSATTA